MERVYNFSAGPAMLPSEVLEQAQRELLNWQGNGCSVMEMSHRSAAFMNVAETAENDLRELLNVPANYRVLFMHGGGRGQFSAIPMNLTASTDSADFLVTGSWSKGAVQEGNNYINAHVVGGSYKNDDGITTLSPVSEWAVSDKAKYFHYCPNETVDGFEITEVPDIGNAPVIADMSSCILSREIDINQYGLIYAGAQKNIGPSGLSIVIVRDDLLGNARSDTPQVMNYEVQNKHGSMYNTPPTFAWYLSGLVFQWLKKQGGVANIAKINQQKSDLLYACIDQSDFYRNTIDKPYRSRMNVPFQLADASLDSDFLAYAESQGLTALKGHRMVGGMRASIYNAMPLSGVAALVDCMKEFERKHG